MIQPGIRVEEGVVPGLVSVQMPVVSGCVEVQMGTPAVGVSTVVAQPDVIASVSQHVTSITKLKSHVSTIRKGVFELTGRMTGTEAFAGGGDDPVRGAAEEPVLHQDHRPGTRHSLVTEAMGDPGGCKEESDEEEKNIFGKHYLLLKVMKTCEERGCIHREWSPSAPPLGSR